ncbi:MAG: polymer-forming cytoskeletal protein [Burkholderiaceae bacterium]|jgi:cytoskeletal protein CcmA (bactofilin family)|nr:polymer-forming cytoskeletal protein [Burkholderiaceae bacterium]
MKETAPAAHEAETPFEPYPADGSSEPFGADATPTEGLAVDLGSAMPSAVASRLPMLSPQTQGVATESSDDSGRHSRIAAGIAFKGNATLQGPMSISGRFEGNIAQATGCQVSVVIAEEGEVRGDIRADKVSVMGLVDGLIDAGAGQVSLHDGSSVSGHVRYGRIQVNGADLNATLERVGGPSTGSRRSSN